MWAKTHFIATSIPLKPINIAHFNAKWQLKICCSRFADINGGFRDIAMEKRWLEITKPLNEHGASEC
jgi:hypothetical protein